MLIVFCVWSLSSLLFVVFGIFTLSAKKPTVFWTHERKIEVSNVKAYNKALALLYFVYSFVILILGIPNIPFLFLINLIAVYLYLLDL